MNGKYSNDSPWIVDSAGSKISGISNPDGTQSSLAYVGTNLPNIKAEETLYPYRVVMAGVNAFGALAATMDGDTLLGVTDGTTRTPAASQHALSGEVVRLQQGDFVQVTAGGTVAVSDLLIPTNEGKVIAYTGTSATCLLQAMQAGSNGTVIWCKKVGAFGIGGSSPITGGLSINVQEFEYSESGQVWTKPAGAYMVYVTMCGAGCDGPDFSAGTGGSAGMTAQKWFIASLLPSTVGVVCGLNSPFGFGFNVTACTYFGDPNGVLYLAAAAQRGGASDADAGIDVTTYYHQGSLKFGQGAGDDSSGQAAGAHGYAQGPGGGGTGGGAGYGSPNGNAGGRAGTNAWPAFTGGHVQTGGGGAGGIGGGATGGNAPAAGYDPVTGFGHGGGGGGFGTDVGGNGGNAVRGGGGGAPGYGVNGLGLPGAGGTGFVRVTTICFS